MLVRPIRPGDGAQFLDLARRLDAESPYLMYEPGERTTTAAAMEERIHRMGELYPEAIFVAEADGQLVGFLEAWGEPFHRKRHAVHIAVAILEAYTGRGIGRALFRALEEWALRHSIHRLELTVMAHNARAIALYERLGFVREGVARHSLLVDDAYVDEYYMARLLP